MKPPARNFLKAAAGHTLSPPLAARGNRGYLWQGCILALLALLQGLPLCRASGENPARPNFIVIFTDDQGYGDLGCYGHPTIRTPHLDRMAREGQRWTSFYAAASVCTPSRAALLTGRWPVRSGMCSNRALVLSPFSGGGLPADEITIAEALKSRGYATACFGKWHLGHLPQYLPTRNGFDTFYGTPYSNDEKVSDTWRAEFSRAASWDNPLFYHPRSEYWDIPLMRNEEILERPVDQTLFTQRYTEQAITFIKANKSRPFFVYLAHNMPHVPLFASASFRGRSARGLYGDTIEEIDWGAGRILGALREEGLEKNTLVFYSSDNGHWSVFREHGGSAGPLRDAKGTTWEGGMRVPAIFYWPGRVKAGTIMEIGSTLDMFTTLSKLAGAKLPEDRVIDGLDLSPVLFGTGRSPRDVMIYYRGATVYAARYGAYKAHFATKPGWGPNLRETRHDPPLLYNLEHDPSESFDVSREHPEIIAAIRDIVARHEAGMVAGEDQLVKRIPREDR